MSDNVLQIIVNAVDNATGILKDVGGSLDILDTKSKSAAAAFSAAGAHMTSMGQALIPASLGVSAGMVVATKAAIDFEQKMELLRTQAGLTQTQVDGLKDKVLALGPVVGQGPTQLAEAFYHIASAGNGIWGTAQMLDILKVSAQGAAIGQANLDDTTYSLTSALASNVQGAKNAAEMMSTLNAIVGAGDMRFQDLNGAIATGFLSTAATFGVSVQSMGTALATLTDNGEHADAAATRLRMTMALMAAPSTQAANVLKAIGLQGPEVVAATTAMTEALTKAHVTTTTLAADMRQPNGIMVALKDLKTHLEASGVSADAADAILSRAFGGGQTDAAMLTLLQNLDRMKEKFTIIQEGTKKFGDDWAAQQDTAAQHVKTFQAQVDVLGVKLGNTLLPALTHLATNLGRLVDWFSSLNPQVQQFIVIGSAILAVLAPLLLILGGVASGIGVIIPLVTAVGVALAGVTLVTAGWAIALAALAILAVTHWQTLVAVFQNAWTAIGNGVTWLKGHWSEALGEMLGFTATLPIRLPIYLIEALGAMVIAITRVNWGQVFSVVGNGLQAAFTNVLNWLLHFDWANFFRGVAKGAASGIPGMGDALHALHLPGFATGGIVPGPIGEPTLAIVHGGEAITPPGKPFAGGKAAGAGGNSPIVHIENFHTYNQADINAFAERLSWRLT